MRSTRIIPLLCWTAATALASLTLTTALVAPTRITTPKTTVNPPPDHLEPSPHTNTDSNAEREPCNVVFTHTNADFDSLAAAVALALLWNSLGNNDGGQGAIPTHVVLPRGVNPVVQRFLAFHKQLLPLRGFKTIQQEDVNAIGVVDAQVAGRIGRGQQWLETAQSIAIFDHHDGNEDDEGHSSNNNNTLLGMATEVVIDKVGSTTTLLVERLKEAGIVPAPHEATLFVLGIRADTGGLVYESSTIRDAAALLWCLQNGASQTAISEFAPNRVTEEQRLILNEALANTETQTIHGLRVSSVFLRQPSDQYVAGLAQVCEEVRELTDSDVLILAATHRSGSGRKIKKTKEGAQKSTEWISLIGRASSRSRGVDLNAILQKFKGGGHPKAAAATVRCQCDGSFDDSSQNDNPPPLDNDDSSEEDASLKPAVQSANQGQLPAEQVLNTVMALVQEQIPEQLVAANCMVPAQQITCMNTDHTVAQARQLFDAQNLTSAPVVDMEGVYKSSLKLNDLVKASRAGRSNDKLKGMLKPNAKTVLPDTTLADLEHLLIHEGVGRIPVVDEDGSFLGMVTRTDVLRQHHLYDE